MNKMTKVLDDYKVGDYVKPAPDPNKTWAEAQAMEADKEKREARTEAQKALDLDYRLRTQFGELKFIDSGRGRIASEELAYKFFCWAVAALTPRNTEVYAKALRFCRDHGILKALNEGLNEQGGALVPLEFDQVLIKLIEKFGVFRQNTKVRLMKSDVKTVGRRTSGLTANWLVEGQSITASEPTYDAVGLVAKKLGTITAITSEINEDAAVSIADELAAEIAQAFAEAEDLAGFLGDGSPTFGNIFGVTQKLKGLSGTIANIAGLKVAAGNLFSEFLYQDFIDTTGLLPAYADRGAAWYCHRQFYTGTMQKLEAAANVTSARDAATGRPLFLNYPVNFTQVMPRTDANSQIAALFGDLALSSTLGDRRSRTLFTNPYALADSDRISVRGIERVDMVTHSVGNASSVAADRVPGPIVGLISAAS